MADEVRSFPVVSYGGRQGSGDPHPLWFSNQGQAEYEVKRRLGVRRLHQRATVLGVQCEESTRIHDGFEWGCSWVYDFAAVTPSQRDYGRFKLFKMIRGNAVTIGQTV